MPEVRQRENMFSLEEAFHRLSGETKALILISEYVLGKWSLPELRRFLDLFLHSDLERIGILDLIRQKAPMMGLMPGQIEALCRGLMEPASGRSETQVTQIEARGAAFPPPSPSSAPPSPSPLSSPLRGEEGTVTTFRVKQVTSPRPIRPRPFEPPPLEEKGESAFSSSSSSSRTFLKETIEKMASRKILLADDDARIRLVFRKKLEEAHFLIDEAENGDVA